MRPLILTARLDQNCQRWLQHDRDKFFNPEKNIVPVHLTLFHHLPGRREDEVRSVIDQHARGVSKFIVTLDQVKFLGFGFAIFVNSDQLIEIRKHLVEIFDDSFTPQDRQKFQPHITIQNKVSATQAKTDYANYYSAFKPQHCTVVGLDLWHYLPNGRWELVHSYHFAGSNGE